MRVYYYPHFTDDVEIAAQKVLPERMLIPIARLGSAARGGPLLLSKGQVKGLTQESMKCNDHAQDKEWLRGAPPSRI